MGVQLPGPACLPGRAAVPGCRWSSFGSQHTAPGTLQGKIKSVRYCKIVRYCKTVNEMGGFTW